MSFTLPPSPTPPPLCPQGLHSASVPGILALDLSGDSSRALTGGADKTAVVFHKDSEQIIATLRGHTKKVTGVVYHPREVGRHTFMGEESTKFEPTCKYMCFWLGPCFCQSYSVCITESYLYILQVILCCYIYMCSNLGV